MSNKFNKVEHVTNQLCEIFYKDIKDCGELMNYIPSPPSIKSSWIFNDDDEEVTANILFDSDDKKQCVHYWRSSFGDTTCQKCGISIEDYYNDNSIKKSICKHEYIELFTSISCKHCGKEKV